MSARLDEPTIALTKVAWPPGGEPMNGRAESEQGSRTQLTAQYLEEHEVHYEVLEHEPGFSAAAEARAAGVTPANAAKSVLLRDRGVYRLAVIPASERLALGKLRDLLASHDLRLATEREIASDFPAFEVGALPPLGPMLSMPEVVDARVLDHERVLCNAGDHRHSVLLDPHELVRATQAGVADICED
jgi:Ala-tRNA(Pro) deacylase